MSIINSTGLYGSSYLFDDVETLKTSITEHDTRIDTLESDDANSKSRLEVLEGDNTLNKSNISTLEGDNITNKSNITTLTTDNTTNKSNIATLTTDNTTNKTNITGNTSRITTLEGDNTTNKTNISTHTTQIESLQLYDTSFNLRLQAIEGTEGTPGDTSLTIPIPAIPSTGLIALAGSVLLATGASITANGVTALTLIDMLEDKVDSNNSSANTKIDTLEDKVDSNNTSVVMIDRFNTTQFVNNETTSKLEILSTWKPEGAVLADTANYSKQYNIYEFIDIT